MDLFGIPSVVETVLQHLDTKYTALYRLVNSTWNQCACKILQTRVIITFRTSTELTKYNDTFQSQVPRISISFQSFHFPITLFSSAVEQIASGNVKRLQDDLEVFLKLSGDQVTQLSLVVCPVLPVASGTPRYTTVMFTEMLKMIYTRLPKLENLQLLFISSSAPIKIEEDDLAFQTTELVTRYSKKILTNLQRVKLDMEIAPNLDNKSLEQRLIRAFVKTLLTTAVNVESISSGANPPHTMLQECLLNSLPFMSPSTSLKNIHVRLPMSPESLLLWSTLNFQNLESVHLEIETSAEATPGLQHFLSRYCTSLRKLNLASREPSPEKFFMQFPLDISMYKLESLTLEQFDGSLDWKKLAPLKHLRLQNSSFVGIAHSFMASSSVLPRVSAFNSLEITEGTLEREEDFLHAFTKFAPYCLPHLTTLTIAKVQFDPPLVLIFTKCIQLRQLTVQKCGGVTDPVLCGMRPALIDVICPVEPPQDSGTEILDKAFQKMVTLARSSGQSCAREFPFIGNLKELRELTLEGQFTDAGVLYGIIACEKLKRVNLKSESCSWRSPRIILQANLLHLTSAIVNGNKVNFSGGLRDP